MNVKIAILAETEGVMIGPGTVTELIEAVEEIEMIEGCQDATRGEMTMIDPLVETGIFSKAAWIEGQVPVGEVHQGVTAMNLLCK